MPSFITRTVITMAVAAGLALGTPAVAHANANVCDLGALQAMCEFNLGSRMRAQLGAIGVQRPNVGDRVLGRIANDICTENFVRAELAWVLTTPDMQIPAFFRAGHRAC